MTPGKAGQDVEGIPVFDTVADAVAATGATATFIAVPPKAASARDSRSGRGWHPRSSCASPRASPPRTRRRSSTRCVRDFPNTRLLGPNCPGIISPGKCNIGITAGEIALLPSPAGPTSASSAARARSRIRRCTSCKQPRHRRVDVRRHRWRPRARHELRRLPRRVPGRPETDAIIMIGEIGGSAEEEAAEFITANVTKPMSAYIAGVTAPAGKKMGHAGAIVSGGKGTAQGKMDALGRPGSRSDSTRPRPANSWRTSSSRSEDSARNEPDADEPRRNWRGSSASRSVNVSGRSCS